MMQPTEPTGVQFSINEDGTTDEVHEGRADWLIACQGDEITVLSTIEPGEVIEQLRGVLRQMEERHGPFD